MNGSQDLEVSNPHDVAVTKDGKEVIVANLNPSQIWLFSDDENKGQLISEQIFSGNNCLLKEWKDVRKIVQ